MPQQAQIPERIPRAAIVVSFAVIAGLIFLLVVVRVMSSPPCRIRIVNDDATTLVRITVVQVGQTIPVLVLANVPAKSTVVGTGCLEQGVESFATVETDAGTTRASLGTVDGEAIKEAVITVKGGSITHVHYR